MIIAIIAPSGAGKTFVETLLVDVFGLRRLISTTTRKQRADESDKAYNFTTVSDFLKGIAQGVFAEHIMVYGNHYGLTHSEITQGDGVVVVEIEGLKQLKKIYDSSQVYSIFLDVPEDIRKERLKNDVARLNRVVSDRHMFDLEAIGHLIDMKLPTYGDWDVEGFKWHIKTLLERRVNS